MVNDHRSYTSDDINQIVNNFAKLPKQRQSATQKGGATSMPLQWYNPIGGGLNFEEAIIKDAQLKDLGDGELVITPENKEALFHYVIDLYKNDKNINIKSLTDAENNDTFIWAEWYDHPISNVAKLIKDKMQSVET